MRLSTIILGVVGLVSGVEDDLAFMRSDPAAHQLVAYKMSIKEERKTLTISNGAPVDYRDTNSLNDNLILNPYFLDSIMHMTQERIPERIVHTKGAGAFGYFEVTHDIQKYCKAKLFEYIGKKTPLVVRFSTSIQDRGSSDLWREARGYAVKFYTEDGNWDMVGFNTPVYFYKDPQYFVGFVHSQKKNQVTAVRDINAIFDFLTLRPETLHEFLWIFSDIGIPDGYRRMSGFSIHTYELVNEHGESHFARFHFITDQGIKNIPTELALQISAQDADYAIRDLYNAIANGSFPSWTMYIEVMSKEEVEKADFDPFDVTLLWPKGHYPLLPVGKLILNRNPSNYFADVEKVAMNPGHLVPGIAGPPDKMFEGRVLAYKDAQNYRLGVNHNKIPVNCLCMPVLIIEMDCRL
ncbi:Catalase [Eumeta japonica]|uniref:Catalase n=1 Tax=Eumeta variegata TaxID=151549 RepID=A0A4C2A6E2_EUMVA|nr:Catalase [Eumeta japonica]